MLALGLDIGAIIAAHIRALVIMKPRLPEGGINQFNGAGNLPFLVGVLNAQDELAVVLFGEQVGVQRRAQAPQMQVSGGAGGETGADCLAHGLPLFCCHQGR